MYSHTHAHMYTNTHTHKTTASGTDLIPTLYSLIDTFMVEDAVEAIGFGKFQWKLSVLTGLAWVSTVKLVSTSWESSVGSHATPQVSMSTEAMLES